MLRSLLFHGAAALTDVNRTGEDVWTTLDWRTGIVERELRVRVTPPSKNGDVGGITAVG